MSKHSELTERQGREVEYHREHAKLVRDKYKKLSHDVLYSNRRRWWNAYWDMFTYLREQNLKGRTALVVGCGGGEDAVRLALLGATVHAFDLSPEMLAIAAELASSEGVTVQWKEMPAERLDYPDDFFDMVFARDIFHHVDIRPSVHELRRVSKPNATFVIDEIYSHSAAELIRRSQFVEKHIYPLVRSRIYAGKPYITEDERKLTETDVQIITENLRIVARKYFNFIVTRLISDRHSFASMVDRLFLCVLGPLGKYLAGRVVIIGTLQKQEASV